MATFSFEEASKPTPEQKTTFSFEEANKPEEAPPKKGVLQKVGEKAGQFAKDVVGGAIRGAGSIGATMMAVPDYLGLTGMTNKERRESMDLALQDLVGSDPNSLTYKGAKIGTEIAGTLPLGGIAGKAILTVAPKAIPLAEAAATGGMTAHGAGLGTRAAGAAISGGVSAAAVDPRDTLSGAAVGAATPVVVAGAGKVGRVVSNALRTGNAAAAGTITDVLGVKDAQQAKELVNKLRTGEEILPGVRPKVSEVLRTPESAVLEDVVHDATPRNALRDANVKANAARLNALESVAPTEPLGPATAKTDLGNAVSSSMKEARNKAKAQVSRLFSDASFDEVRMAPPIEEMRAIYDKYLGPGTFDQGSKAAAAVKEAVSIGEKEGPAQVVTKRVKDANGIFRTVQETVAGSKVPRLATWDELQKLRSNLGDAARKAVNDSNQSEAAALTAMKEAIDKRIEDVSNGIGRLKGEKFSAEAKAAYEAANEGHAARKLRFDTGPQKDIFRTSSRGTPVVEDSEIISKFWGARPGLESDVKAFNRLVGDNSELLGQFRSMITTEGASTVAASGKLTSKFPKWLESHLPGIRQAFPPEKVDMLLRISADIERANEAAAAAATRGSKTYQSINNATKLGVLENPLTEAAASKVPLGKTALAAVQNSAKTRRSNKLAELMADPELTANEIEKLKIGQARKHSKVVNALAPIAYRAPPVVAAQQ